MSSFLEDLQRGAIFLAVVGVLDRPVLQGDLIVCTAVSDGMSSQGTKYPAIKLAVQASCT